MKKCCASVFYVLPLANIAAAAILKRNPGVTVGIGSTNTSESSDGKSWSNTANSDKSLPEYVLTLQNYKGVQYYAPITLNDQTLNAVYDTGSFEVMAMSSTCSACKVPASQAKYDAAASSTFAAGNGVEIDHHFAGGLVVAKQDYETLHVGDFGKSMTVNNMPFWQVTHTEMRVWQSNKAHFTAIVGLGHRTMVPDTPSDQVPVPSLLERTDTERFSICLQRGMGNPGYITFNPHVDSPALDGSPSTFRRVPVIGKNHWAVSLNAVSHGADKRCSDGISCLAIVDSGTSLIGVPPMAVPMIMNIIQNIKQDCSNVNYLEDLVFDLGGHKLALPSSAYVIKFQTPEGVKCLPAFTDFDMESAHGAVWILGMPFLRHFYTVFDRTEPSIYVADQGENCQPAASGATNFVNASATTTTTQELSFADVSEATLPSWAFGTQLMDV